MSELDQLGLITSDVISQGRYGRLQKIRMTIDSYTFNCEGSLERGFYSHRVTFY